MSWVQQILILLTLAVSVPVYARDYGGCGERGSPTHGYVRTIIRRAKGLMVQYHCNALYQRVGHMYSVCIDGRWSTPLPSCVKESKGLHVMSDAAKQDKVFVSLEELHSTQQTVIKNKVVKRPKKKRKKKQNRKKGNRTKTGNNTSMGLEFDMTCLISIPGEAPKFVRAPRVYSSLGPKFVRRKKEKRKYLVAIYHCSAGYKLHSPQSHSLGCIDGKWVGQLPICLPKQRKISCASRGCQHVCKEVLGKPKCFCFKGFHKNGNSCVDIIECSVRNGGCAGTCHNTPGSYYCACAPGYRLASDHSSCIDTNECLSRNGHGPCQVQCTNIEGSYICSCEGMPGTQIAHDGISCRDIDECSEQEYLLGCSHSCINTLGTAFCVCPKGYQLGADWRTCQDINECTDNSSICKYDCKNTPGSYSCSCPPGFTSSGGECVDINECAELENELCSHICENSIGSYKCACPSADHELSTDHRTCHLKKPGCRQNNCTQGCVVDNEIIICVCDEGYVLENNTKCVDVDECQSEFPRCSHNCINEEGSFHCTCPKGMVLLLDNATCHVGQCDWSVCPQGCQNENCDYKSVEHEKSSTQRLEDITDCDVEINNCSQLHINFNESSEYYCNKGFYLDKDKHTCVDIDECAYLSLCGSHQCVNTEGSYYCKCSTGYTMNENSRKCEDIDECDFMIHEGSKICSHFCVNSLGSFYCSCPFGFVIGNDSKTCNDVDECMENNLIDIPCSQKCVNDIGSYHCECPLQGYVISKDGRMCLKSHGCHILNGGCSHICTEDDGEPMCDCPEGLTLDNDNVTCLKTPCSENNGGCSQICDDSSGFCFCNDGFILHQDLKLCLDLNECLENNGNCSHNCVNTEGSYYCTCDFGFQEADNDSQICKDIDECRSNNETLCNQLCINSEGSYNCDCLEGYLLSTDGVNCDDIDECENNKNKCSHNCVNMVGSFRCECDTGFSLSMDNYTCEDIDECSLNISNCSQICTNIHGGYFCESEAGFNIVNKTQCVESIKISNVTKCDSYQELSNGDATKSGCNPILSEDHNVQIDCGSLSDNYPEGTECKINCKIGFIREGSSLRICVNGSWTETDASCKVKVHPYIRCPPPIRVNLPLGENKVVVKLPQPITNMDWQKHVSSSPIWGKSLTSSLQFGTTLVQFTVQSPSSSYTAKCNISIHVKDAEKPIISHCPKDISIQVGQNQETAAVDWAEPIIADNVQVAHIFQSQRSGTQLNKGLHFVNYIAVDSSGNIATCQFKINVTGGSPTENKPLAAVNKN